MAITTTEDLEVYLNSKNIPFSTLTRLTGGSSNFVWRRTDLTGKTSIIKHAAPFHASNSLVPFPVHRQAIEVHALDIFPSLLPMDDVISLPKQTYCDFEANILILEDVGGQTLHELYEHPNLDVPKVGQSIGRWLARLHHLTTEETIKRPFHHPVIQSMYRWSYNNLANVLTKYGHDPLLGERINAKYGSLIETDDICVCHTDVWPGNILIPSITEKSDSLKVVVIDWEAARIADGVTDVGHFAAEAWFLDQLRGGRGLADAFLESYVNEDRQVLGERERERIAAQFGTHLTFWPTVYKWIPETKKAGLIAYGKNILERVDQKDWEWFKSSELRILFE